MASFFEKLKKGMEIEEAPDTEELLDQEEPSLQELDLREEEPAEVSLAATPPKRKKTTKKPSSKKRVKVKQEKTPPEDKQDLTDKKSWFEQEGQLTVDVYETNGDIVIQSAIAGIKPEKLDITIEDDMVIIKGRREEQFKEEKKNYFHQECYWGYFSREIVLPAEVDNSRAEATMQEGVLTIRIPKIRREKRKKVVVKG